MSDLAATAARLLGSTIGQRDFILSVDASTVAALCRAVLAAEQMANEIKFARALRPMPTAGLDRALAAYRDATGATT